MHRSRDIQVGIFEPWDWVYFQAFPSYAWTEIRANTVFHGIDTGIPVLRKFWFKNLQKILFGEVQVQDPIPVLPGH
jgi:hypothetical protein